MTASVERLIEEIAVLTGASPPAVLDPDAPVLDAQELRADAAATAGREEDRPYFVGLIGGKEVGKSALVNALVGRPVTESSAFGPGTEVAVAYAHASQAAAVEAMLEREVPGRFRVVTHEEARVRRQVLLDLPDIDSHYADHVELTRRILRHLLFPVWMQSIEKYADQQPMRLLAAVAAGNDPGNFLFCLNKVDQLDSAPSPAETACELRDDFARRLAMVLGLAEPPAVYLVSALNSSRADFPALSRTLSRERSDAAVRASRDLAIRRRTQSVMRWVDEQQLPARLERARRLEDEAHELVASRLGVPLVEEALPRLADDPGHRLSMIDEALARRAARWPVVNVVHGALSPLLSMWRHNAGRSAPGVEALVAAYVDPPERPLAPQVRATFAMLAQSDPSVAALLRERRFWDDAPADAAVAELRQALARSIERQRHAAVERIAGGRNPLAWLVRVGLTIGAILWFPFVQPVLEVALQEGWARTGRELALLAVQLLGVTYLLKSVGFLLLWFLGLWLWLRWDTGRRIARLLSDWRSAPDEGEASVRPANVVLRWMDLLLAPLRQHREQLESLDTRVRALAAKPNGYGDD